jgi:uncharacterized DUF497 family protein
VLLEFDPAKNARNIRERAISFERFADMDLETAVSVEDTLITLRGAQVRVISLRRANRREERGYAKKRQSS